MAGEPPAGFDLPTGPGPERGPPISPVRRHRDLNRPATMRSRFAQFIRWPKSRPYITWGVAGLLVISFLTGIVFYWSKQASEQDYVEVYITDLPADFTRLEVRVAGVYVGNGDYPLVLGQETFDLLSLQGPAEALRIASGYVPRGEHDEIRIVFHSARAELNGRFIDLDIPNGVLSVGHRFGLGGNPSSAFLFDIDVERSIQVSADGLLFEPHVNAVFVHHYGSKPGSSIAGTDGPSGFSRPFNN